jgi:hypothetical protein
VHDDDRLSLLVEQVPNNDASVTHGITNSIFHKVLNLESIFIASEIVYWSQSDDQAPYRYLAIKFYSLF